MSQIKKRRTKKEVIHGKEDMEHILSEESYPSIKTNIQCNSQRKKTLLPIACKSVSPVGCFQAIINKHEVRDYQNIYSTILTFLLENIDEIKIKANSTCKIQTNFLFKPSKRVQRKTHELQEDKLKALEHKMKYFIISELPPDSFLQVQVTHGMLSDLLSKPIFLNVANYSSEEIIVPLNTPLCKILFYFDKKDEIGG